MRNTLLSGLSSLLLPLGLYGASATAGASYQRTYLSSSISASSDQLLRTSTALPRDLIDLSGDQLDIQTAHPVRELVIVDGAVAEADKSVLRRALKPGMQLVELDSSVAGLSQLINALDGHKNLAAIHVISHAEAGVILLGNSRITPETIQQEVYAFAALKGAVREGGDLLFYGCDLAANETGEALLDIISNKTGLDVAASNNLTGNSELQGDWDLEVTRGNIESTLAFSEKALRDFSGVLAPFTGTVNFSQTKNAGDYYGTAAVNAEVWATGTSGYFLIIDGATRATELYTGLGSTGQAAFTLNTENSVTLRFNNNEPFSPQSLKVANIAGGGGTTHSFTFTSNKGSFSQNVVNGTPATVDLTSFGANVTYITISSTLVYAWMDNFDVVGVGITVDEDPPVFQNATPSVGSQTLTGATLSADLDEEGTVYYVVVADGAGAPSAAQVLAGQNSSGAAALASGNFTTTTTTGSEAFSGLSSGTNYDLYAVAQDDEGTPNVQASATLVNFTTQGTDSDATLTAAGGVAEPIGLATTIDSVGEAVDVFDFTISDGGTSDGLATTVSQIVVSVSGTSTDAERSKITWRLNGPDASNVTGTYSAGADTITFSGLSMSVADGGNETYTVNAYYNDNTTLTEDRTIILSVDGDTNLTVGGSGTQMASGQSAVTNGSGTTIDVVVSQLVFTTQPAGSVSGAALTTQPVVRARDAFGNTDVDFTETITLTEASAGTLTNGTQAATAGVATFTNLTYTATADQQAFTLTANDQDGVGSNLSTVDANSVTSDVVATKLLFMTQPAPTSVTSGAATPFTTVPVVSAADANDIVDTGYSTDITLAEVNGAGSATMTGTGDTDGNGATVSITPSSGVSTFTGMQITYTNSGVGSETFNLRASSGGLTTADSSQLTAATTPSVTDGNISISGASGTSGAYKIGDTVTATWNNTAGGDNNAGITGVTVDFSQFGGGAAVVASNSSDTWTATYTIVSGGIDTTNRNISVTATNVSGDSTTADTTNATVDNVAPVVTNGSISISGATGTSGAYKIGDTVTATWDNTGGGDNNSDISGATVDFSAFGGGAAVAATDSSGTWTATYTITAGAIDATNLNISVTATDNAGNTTTTADTSNATVDSQAPTVVDGNISISGGSGTAGAYIVGDTVTASWDNSASGDNNSDTISSVTVDFSQFGGGAAVVASNSSDTWTATYTVLAGAIDTTNRNVSVTATDNAGNTRTQADSSNATVDNIAPAVSSVSVPADAAYIAGQNLDFTVNTSQNITVDTSGGTPRIALTIGASTVYASYLSGTGSSALTFRYTIQAGDLDTDGIAAGSAIELNSGTLKDATGNNLTLTLNSVGSLTSVLVDAIAPNAPTSLNLTAGSDTGSSATDDLTSDTTPTITGSAEANSTVKLYDTDGTTLLATTTANGVGNWLTTSSALADGVHSLTAKATDAAGNESVASTALMVTIDTTAPTVTDANISISGGSGTSGAYIVGDTVTAIWNNSAGGDNNSDTISTVTVDFSQFGGGAAVVATNSSDTWTATYTILAGAIDTTNRNVSVTATDNAGNTRTQADSSNATVDNIAPAVSSVTVPANATYGAGQTLDFTVNTDENITVNTGGGTPRIALTLGATTVYASYLSGSGSSALTFRYTVQAGDADSDGIAVAASIDTNGGTLKGGSGNDLVTTLNSVGSTASVLVDAVAPTVSSVSVPSNATYVAGQNLDFTVNTDENITVNTGGGTPQIALTIGATTRQATYLSGSGTSAVVFRYTVQVGDQDSDGVAVAANIVANGGTLRDAAGNDINTTLNSVGSTASVLVDAVAPTVSSVSVPANATYITGQNLDFTVNIDENITVNTGGGTPQIALTIGATTRQATYLSGSGTSAVVFRYTVQVGESDADGIVVGALSANGGTLRDSVGNDLNITLNSVGSTTSVLVDAVAPTVSSVSVPANATYIAGQNLDFTVNTDENITVNTGGGTPQIALTIGATTRQATYLSGSGTSAVVFRYTVQVGESDADGIVVGALSANGGTLRDSAGNDLNITLNSVGSTTSVLVDAVAPTVSSVSVPANATYSATQTLDFTVNTDENITVNTGVGTPRIALTLGASTVYASYLSGSGSSALTFRYTVQVGDLDTDGIALTGSIDLNGGTLKDSSGNDLNLTLNSIGSTTAVLVDAVAPNAPSTPDLDALSDSGSSSTDNITSDTTPTLTGTAEVDSTVTLYDTDGSTVLGTATATGGNWSITSTALSEGSHSLTATATDLATNVSVASAALDITIDTTAPTQPAVPDLATASDTGASDTDNITNLTSLTLQGAAGSVEADASVHARSDIEGGLTNTTANPDGSWSLAVTGLGENTHQLTIRVTDVAGNQSVYSDPLSVVIDTTVPTVGGVTFDQASVTAANSNAIGLTLAAAETSTTASYSITSDNGGTAVTATGLAVSSTTQQFTAIDVSGLNDGTLTVSLTLVDVAGNTSTAVTNTVSKDANVPTVSSVAITNGNYAEGDVISVSLTLDEDVTVTGTSSTLAIDIGGTTRQAVFVSENAGVLTYQYTVQANENTSGTGVIALANGITLNGDTVRDAGDNDALLSYAQTSNANAQVDTTAPTDPVVLLPAAAVSVNADDYAVSGTHAEDGVTISLYLDADNNGVADNALVLDSAVVASGAWSLIAPLTADSANNFVVVVEDAAGNLSAAVDVPTITEDSIAPAAPAAADLLAASDSGTSDTDDLTSNTTPTLTGTAEPNSTVTLTSDLDGVVGTAVADGAGDWSITASTLSAGVHSLTTTATDAADNMSSLSAALNVTIDNQAPTLTAVANQSLNPSASSSALAVTLGDDASTPANLTFTATSSDLAVVPLANVVLGGADADRTVTVTALGSGTSTITLSVEDEAGNTGTGTFTVSVNSAPTISGTPTTSVNQGASYSFTPTGNDVDTGSTLTYSITNKPGWAVFSTVTGALTGTPTNADVGTTSSIVISVSDGTLSASLAAFDLVVSNVNEVPIITGTPTISVDQDVAYSFTPTASDVDVGDVLTYSITNKPTWASFDTVTGALTGTPTHDDVGTTTGIVISVSDGTLSADLLAFNLEVVETIDPLQPVVTAPVDIVINSTGLYTPISLRQLLSLNVSATQEQIDQILAGMASDGVSGNTCCITNPEGLNINNMLLLPPGRHQVIWKATNAADISGTAIQTVDIRPLVSLSKSQIAIRGSTVEFRVLFNGKAPEYPVSIPYVIDASTTAGSNEHNLVNGIANFTTAGQMEVVVPVQLANVSGLSDSELVVSLDGDINAGAANTHTIRIREGNIPPIAILQLSQGGVNTTQITPAGGLVTVTATVADLNTGDTQAYDWSASDTALGDTDGNPVNNTLVFDPTGLSGRHQVQLTVTDSGGAAANVQLYFRVVANLPVLQPDTDTDGDGVDDQDEGLGDANNNGIPDYLDNMPSDNILPQVGTTTNSYLIECDPGVRCGLGKFALTGNSGGVQILDEELGATGELIVDPAFEPVGGIFDFVINDLPTPGQSVRIVIPQQAVIPANATYRKYQKGRWVNFVANANNSIFSAPGNPGYCPPPGNPDWTPGLTEGNLCVQLTIEDGGPNDDDGLVNSAIADPGAVSVAVVVEPPPPPPKPPVEIKSKGGGAMDGFWLLLLGGLMVFKRVKPMLIALVALVVSAGNVQAGVGDDVYIRADVSAITSSQNEDKFSAALMAAGHEFVISHYDENRSGYHLAVGYEWSNFAFTEVGYLDLGDVRVNLTLPGTANVDAFAQDFAANYPMSAEGVTLVQGLVLNPASAFKVSAEIGVFVWRSKTGIERQVFSVADDEGEDPLVGLKFELPLSEQLGLGLGIRRVYFDTQEADLFSLTGSYHF